MHLRRFIPAGSAALLGLGLLLGHGRARAADPVEARELRPPSVPLVACDPYFSVWSNADRLTDDSTRHWTGKKQSLSSLIRVDGKTYRLMGDEPRDVPALPQVGLKVLPTRTIYDFEGPEAHVTLTFLTAALPDDLDVLARPLTYLTWEVRAVDGKRHPASLFFSASSELAVNSPEQRVTWSREPVDGLTALRVGSEDQAVLRRKGDDLRIDWGRAYVAAPEAGSRAAIGPAATCSQAFVAGGGLPDRDDPMMPRAVADGLPVLAFAFDLGEVADRVASRHLMLAYDDGYSITYFRRNLRPYWRKDGAEAADLLRRGEADYPGLRDRCRAFDDELMADLRAAGGEKYARLAALAYRQALAAHKLAADSNGQPLLFSKENFSNGCIATVDVIYPTDPIFLLFSPTLAKASLVPVLAYAASDRWKFPFAPHDLGTYPLANGQVYGGGERTEVDQMPVEETGNMLLLLAAVARQDGNADFVSAYWPQLKRWAAYLEEKGFDPENQLCTDDFAGHLAHNVNLSAKAILALGAYGILAELRGEKPEGARYRELARTLANRWVEAAADGDHTRLAFDRPGTWSQKYNLVWDHLLGLDLFPPEAIKREMAFYLGHMDRYGLPLDSRRPYAKLDWTVWTATLAGSRGEFEALVGPLYDFLDQTPTRVPMSDWYWTRDAKQAGFQARSVVGGVFIKLLADPATRAKWAARDRSHASGWAPIPKPPTVLAVVPTARDRPADWRITTERPEGDWPSPTYADSRWKQAAGGFGTAETPGTVGALRTTWNTPDIWLRREFALTAGPYVDLQLDCFHDEDAEIYLNGVLAAKPSGYSTDYETLPIAPAARAALHPGKNVLAVHCHQTRGGQYIDVGIAEVREASAAQPPPATDARRDDPGFVPIFDGKSLAGWHVSSATGHGTGGRWVVEDGAIVGGQDRPGNGGIVITDKAYGDFEVILEMNNDFGPDSGLFLRSTEKGQAYQAMVNYHAGGNLMGVYGEGLSGRIEARNFDFLGAPEKIVPHDAPFPLPFAPEHWAGLWKHGQWNELRARIVGNPPTVTTWINGEKIMEFTDAERRHPDAGGIALQVHGGGDTTKQFVRYRNVRVKELGKPDGAPSR